MCFRCDVQAVKFGTKFAIPHRLTAADHEGAGWCLTLDNGARVRAGSVNGVVFGVGKSSVVSSKVCCISTNYPMN